MSRSWVAGVCLTTCLVPVVWQQARLSSARGEQERMERLLAALQLQNAAMTNDLFLVRQQIAGTLEHSNVVPAVLAGSTNDSKGLETRLFLWDEKAAYVRVPKSLFKHLQFDASKNRWRLHAGQLNAIDRDTGRVSASLLEVLGLSADEKMRVQEIVSRHLKSYDDWSAQNGSMAEMSGIADKLNVPKETQATVYLPSADLKTVKINGRTLAEKPEIKAWPESGKWVVLTISSGNYQFECETGGK